MWKEQSGKDQVNKEPTALAGELDASDEVSSTPRWLPTSFLYPPRPNGRPDRLEVFLSLPVGFAVDASQRIGTVPFVQNNECRCNKRNQSIYI